MTRYSGKEIRPADASILQRLAEGMTTKEIAFADGVTTKVMSDRIGLLIRRMDCLNREQAVALWTRLYAPKVRVPLPAERSSVTHKVYIESDQGTVSVYITAGYYEDGRVGEVFVQIGKQGSTLRGALDAWSRMVSVALQYGVPVKAIAEKFTGVAFEPAGKTNDRELPVCTSIVDYVMRWVERNKVR